MNKKQVRRKFSFGAAVLLVASIVVVGLDVEPAGADAGNPILGTIKGSIVKTNPNDPNDARVTVYVRGQWNWYSHGSDCNTNRAGAGVGIIWNDPTEPGYTVTKGSISAGVGTSQLRSGDTDNTIDEMVHPSDLGNKAEGYDGYAGQSFADPSPPSPNSYSSWKGGCGREPLSATSSPGPGAAAAPSGQTCADGSTTCAGHPWGSWGYLKTDGKGVGYKHTFARREDVTSVCVNFYDVHGGGTGSKLQVVNGSKEIDVNGNGDNSIQTNAFNTNQGANCIYFPQLTTQATSGKPTDSIHDTANVKGAPPSQSATFDFRRYSSVSACNADSGFTGGTVVGSQQTVTTSSTGTATATSADLTKPVPEGDYFWRVKFTVNGTPWLSDCNSTTEKSHVQRQPTSTKTGQKVKIQDFARIDGFISGGSGGTVTFKLYPHSANCTGTPTFQQTVAIDANGRANTTSSQDLTTSQGGDVTWDWLVVFNGDTVNAPSTSACGVEHITLFGNTAGVDP